MSQTYDCLFKNGIVVSSEGQVQRDIGVKDGRIASMDTNSTAQAGMVIDCKGLHILPGVIDSQVHFREPGLEQKEDLETGANGAVLGGVTTVFEMPNTVPQTTTIDTLQDKFNRAKGRMSCDHAFFVGGTAENYQMLPELEKLPGVAGIKVFMGSSTGSLLVEDDATLIEILKRIKRRAAFHAEDETRLQERRALRVPGDPASHPIWRDEQTALKATQRLVMLASKYKARVHILHISTAQEMEYLKEHKKVATVEVTPHHLSLHAPDCYNRLGTLAQMNPPVRGPEHQKALWQGIINGTVDILGSDHAPHTREEKSKPYPNSPSGMTGVQTLVPLMLNAVNKGKLTLERFVALSSEGPRRVFNIKNKGKIGVGYDADFTIVDMKRKETITNGWIASRAGWTPYDGLSVTGWPVGTIIRGNKVMWDGEIVNKGLGQRVEFAQG